MGIVLPNDLDIYFHMNNGRYLTLMDIGRLDLLMRCGLAKVCLKRGWNPMIAAVFIRFRKGLKPFQKYEIRTRVIGWDERFIYLEQKFMLKGNVIAAALLKGSFVHKKIPVPSDVVHKASGSKSAMPKLPDYVVQWQKTDQLVKDSLFS